MRAGRGLGVVLALALGGCRASAPGAPTDAGVQLAAGSNGHLDCEALLPGEVRELALPGFSVQQERPCPMCGPLCTFHSAVEPGTRVSLGYTCEPRDSTVDVRELLAPMLKAGGSEVPALGRAAARRTPAPGMLQVVAWDDDTPCTLVVTWLGANPERALEFMHAALGAVSATSLGAALAVDAGLPPLPAPEPTPEPTPDAGLP